MKICVETHADDAFLSMGQHLEDWHKQAEQTGIVTVFSGTRKRGAEAERFANAVGARWWGLGFTEQTNPSPDQILKTFYEIVYPWINKQESEIFINLAVIHPEHKLVREALEIEATALYLDQPYSTTSRNCPKVLELVRGREILSYCHPLGRKYRHTEIFKDQGRFFFYNPKEKLMQSFEMIVTK